VPAHDGALDTGTGLLANYSLRLKAPQGEESKTYVTRDLPQDRNHYRLRLPFYVPPQDPTVPAYDGFWVADLPSTVGFAFHDDDLSIDRYDHGYGYWYEDLMELEAGQWHVFDVYVTTSLDPETGQRTTYTVPYIDGEYLYYETGAPSNLLVGDTSEQVDLTTTGNTGTGELYLDDLGVRAFNDGPAIEPLDPAEDETVGGHRNVSGVAGDPDPRDAVQSVSVALYEGDVTDPDDPPLADLGPAEGTTNWTQLSTRRSGPGGPTPSRFKPRTDATPAPPSTAP
jgi:hypothetical protein